MLLRCAYHRQLWQNVPHMCRYSLSAAYSNLSSHLLRVRDSFLLVIFLSKWCIRSLIMQYLCNQLQHFLNCFVYGTCYKPFYNSVSSNHKIESVHKFEIYNKYKVLLLQDLKTPPYLLYFYPFLAAILVI